MTTNYTNKLSKYITAATLAAVSSNISNAEIVYVDVDPDHSIPQFHNTSQDEFFDIIIEGDTVMKVGNWHGYWTANSVSTGNPGSSGTWNGLWAVGVYSTAQAMNNSSNAVVKSGSFGTDPLADTLITGDLIGSSLSWSTWGWLGYFSVWGGSNGQGIVGKFNNTTDKYVGTRFNINGEVHYGWLRFDVSDYYSTFSFKDYAYENCPGAPIKAGQMTGGVGMADTVTLTGCDEVVFNGKIYTQTGMVYDTVSGVSQFGCDSITPLNITINNSVLNNVFDTINDGESVFLAGENQTTTGVYTDSLTAANGCDSVVVTNLTVSPLGVNKVKEEKFKVYPNPSSNSFNIDLSDLNGNIEVEVYNSLGKVESSYNVKQTNNLVLEIQKRGVYYLVIKDSNASYISKLVKE